MDNHTDFYAFYNRVLRPEIARIEPLREQTVTRAWAIAIATVLATAAWAMLAARLLGWDGSFVYYSCVIPVIVGLMVWGPVWSKYRDDYQLKLIAAIVRLYDESFDYDRDAAVGEVAFTDCGLFPSYLNGDNRHYGGRDRVSGKVGVTPFEFSDLDASISAGKSRREIFK